MKVPPTEDVSTEKEKKSIKDDKEDEVVDQKDNGGTERSKKIDKEKISSAPPPFEPKLPFPRRMNKESLS